MRETAKYFLYGFFLFATLWQHVQAETGFLNIDCGLFENNNYSDAQTGLQYVSDASFTDSGISKPISSSLKVNSLEQQFWNVRSFPEETRNCYTLSPPAGKNRTYLIRARFMYGNYDSKDQPPEFDLHLGVSYWDTVKLKNSSDIVNKEIVHVIDSDSINLCLINKSGIPFISTIELRLLIPSSYVEKPLSLVNYFRYDFASSATTMLRYPGDTFDRLWTPYPNLPAWSTTRTKLPIDASDDSSHNIYFPGSPVMRTAITPKDPNQTLNFSWQPTDPTAAFYFFMHFAEIEDLQSNQTRVFNITINDFVTYPYLNPDYLYTNTIYSLGPWTEPEYNVALVKTSNSTLPPIWNAFEAYVVRDILESKTDPDEARAMWSIKSAYGIKRNWQGDPCYPEQYYWKGLECDNSNNVSTIKSLNLSSSGLRGKISSSTSNLKSLQTLDLAHNDLTGEIPDFLAQLENLKVINLTSNNLTGSIPKELLQKNSSGSIELRVEGNIHLCMSDSCEESNRTDSNSSKHKTTLIAVGASVGGAFVITTAVAVFLFAGLRRRRKSRDFGSVVDKKERGNLETKQRQFTYSEVLTMTNNFQKSIGKGGFGAIYLGYLDNTPVAVKMLSLSSAQGYREFKAEAELLMRVHHKNLTSLIGYCDENDNIGLIYEYMANGNLEKHLSEKSPSILGWEKRIQIASDAAQGLDYLHNGCKPPIIHRDIKATNILLDENFQAKVADFGLSKAFPNDGITHVTTIVAGTPGYLDPEYYMTSWLNEKSDVYSFGIVLLQIVTGRTVIEKSPEKTHITSWVKSMISKGDITKIGDPRLGGYFDANSARKMIELAMACLSDESIKRPTMNQVVMELEQCIALAKLWFSG